MEDTVQTCEMCIRDSSETYQSDSFAVRLPLAENSLKILEESFTTASGEALSLIHI